MTLVMAVAAFWGVLQLFAISWPKRSVRLSTVLLALAVGVYGCGVATALVQLAYTRIYAEQSGQSLVTVVNTTGYTVAPWVEELLKATPLLLAGLSLKVRRQWGLTDFVVMGAALGAGFGLLEAVLRFGLDADRAMPRDGGWIIPDSLSPPYIPGLAQVLTSWLPAPFSQLDLGGPAVTETFTHLVWTAMAGLGVGLFWRARGWMRLLSAPPILAAAAHHTLNNYAIQEHAAGADQWLDSLDGTAWAAPLVCLALAMAVDLRQLHHGKRTWPGLLLTSERADGDSLGALLRCATWRLPWSMLLVLRYVRLRRSVLYAAASAPPEETEELRQVAAGITTRMDAADNQRAWQTLDIRAWLNAVRRAHRSRGRWLLLIPCVLMLPSLLFLGVGSFTSTAGLQEFFNTGSGPNILMGFGIATLAWITYQLTTLLRTWRATSAHPMGEVLATHRFRLGITLGAATTGTLLLWRGLGDAGADGRTIRTFHLLDALNTFLVYLGFALLLLSLLALFPPGGLALAGGGAVGALTAEAALNAGLLGTAGLVLMGLGASNGGGDGNEGTPSESNGGASGSGSGQGHGKGPWQAGDKIEGPARGKQLRFPNSRHTVSGSGSGMVKERNSVIMRGHEQEVAQDIEGIAAGRAEWVNMLSRYRINGRTYGIEENGTVFPDSGSNIVNLNRIEYGALKEIVRARGDLSAAPRLTRDPKFIENPEAIEKALKIYNGIIP
ncbi:PrsW family glutamic-type intramembrane protease [Streptomyces justiciae]|uniref:PrsW family glutamic-type intramembrane protease n=1 Tax=Streptomyces justiciae TaxID=2780140 RepID=UPI0018812687|nr:PrsW family glutamic-type intramembrane protease [Streptomyces justiciae]MBE8478176.1 PrsW family intramembrane metalloprotease [Streptomyces justiciae]